MPKTPKEKSRFSSFTSKALRRSLEIASAQLSPGITHPVPISLALPWHVPCSPWPLLVAQSANPVGWIRSRLNIEAAAGRRL